MVEFSAEVPLSRTEHAAEAIKQWIFAGVLKPGTPLVETEIASRLGVSKTPVREAIKTLSTTGLVSTIPYKGCAVRVVDEQMVRDVYGVRLVLEPIAVQASVPNHDAKTIAALTTLLSEAQRHGMQQEWAHLARANRMFHRGLYSVSPNPLMREILEGLYDQDALISVVGWTAQPNSWMNEASEHQQILDYVATGDGTRAKRLLIQHMISSRDSVLDSLSRTEAGTLRGA